MTHPEEDWLELLDDEPNPPAGEAVRPKWLVLVVDDDPEIHEATRFALSQCEYQQRGIELIHAHNQSEAIALVRAHPELAAVLLDVVMESNTSGLELIGIMREQLQRTELRIILRTGQPGYAPELDVFTRYDINDYRTKAELTQIRLITCLISALRGYEQIQQLNQQKQQLQHMLKAVADLIERESVPSFVQGIFSHLMPMLHGPVRGGFFWRGLQPGSSESWQHILVPASPSTEQTWPLVWQQWVQQAQKTQKPVLAPPYTLLLWRSSKHEAGLLLETPQPVTPAQQHMLEIWAAHLGTCFSNLQLTARLNQLAFEDALTGLHNSTALLNTLRDLLLTQRPASLWLLDLAHFSDINDGMGQDIGNQLLQNTAQRLQNRFGPQVYLARVGIDVFALVDTEQRLSTNALLEIFNAPFSASGVEIHMNVALGICQALDAGPNQSSWLKRATIALNRAKKTPSEPVHAFRPEMEESTRARLDISNRLRAAFEARQLEVWFQPQLNMQTGQVVGVEGLLRWPDGQGGFVYPPSVFIPLAEYSGLILDIGHWVLTVSCQLVQALQQQGWPELAVAVNVSLQQFRQRDWVQSVQQLLTDYPIPPHLLELEITESVAMDEPRDIALRLQQLKALGVTIAIDDFGTGYSSLGYLQRLPIDRLKIDRSFVMEMETDRGRSLAETIVSLGHRLGLSVVAEGVETAKQMDYLRALGCEQAQGYLYAQAMPVAQLLQWLHTRPR